MGLFVIIGGLEKTGVLEILSQIVKNIVGNNAFYASSLILFFSGFSSGFVDNIPITILLAEIVKEMTHYVEEILPLWFSLTIGADMGGNMTLIGASANVVGADIYQKTNNNAGKSIL